MARWMLNRKAWLFLLLAGTMPLGTVADCNYVPGVGGTGFYSGGDDVVFIGGPPVFGPRVGADVIIVEEEVYYDDPFYYEEEIFYDDEFCDPFFFFGCF